MLHDILFAIWFMLPAAAANATPIFSANLPLLKQWKAPIDGGKSFRGKRILGDNKTWRGVVTGLVVAVVVLWLQQLAVDHLAWARFATDGTPYSSLPTIGLGLLFGIGALGGDALESFFKRQRGIPSGESWIPFDQLDYIAGALVVSFPFVTISVARYIWIIVIWAAMHLIASYIGYHLRLKEAPI